MNTKLKCLLLDDELPGLTYLKMLCEQIPDLEIVKSFNNPVTFLKEMPDLDFDLCIMDIEMPEMNGLHVANLLNGKPVIFTTAYKEYAVEAFDLNAIDYITKPIKKERLIQAIDKAMLVIDRTSSKKNFVQLNTNKGKSVLYFEQMIHFKTDKNDPRDKVLRLSNATELVLKNISLDKLIELLPVDDFCQINRQEIISISCIQFFTFDEITTNFKDKKGKPVVLNLGDTFRSDLLQRLA